jgi:hypothetical protein
MFLKIEKKKKYRNETKYMQKYNHIKGNGILGNN